jgi:methionyl-tRNA formyltransferase
MRLVFMGSAEFACPSLEALLRRKPGEVVGVVTQPDRPKGRSLAVTPCAVRSSLAGRGIPVLTPERVNAPESLEALSALAPDLIVVVAYGQFLGRALLALPPQGCLNVHGSLLPKYRGAAPVQRAIAEGETVSGVTIMRLNERMDAGDILLQVEAPIEPADTGGTLGVKLAQLGAEALIRALEDLAAGRLAGRAQDESAATFAPKLQKSDGILDWGLAATRIANRVRAFNPWPCCACRLPGGGALRVLQARVEPGRGVPGEVLECGPQGPLVAAGEGAVRLLEVQPEGKRAMSGAEFVRGRPLGVGARLG